MKITKLEKILKNAQKAQNCPFVGTSCSLHFEPTSDPLNSVLVSVISSVVVVEGAMLCTIPQL
jgi:hypothetical protein